MQGLSSYYRALCHLVHALQNEGFISRTKLEEEAPMLASFIDVYSRHVFVGANGANGNPKIEVSKGQYETQYLLASHVTAYGLSQHVVGGNGKSSKTREEKRRHEVKQRQRLDPAIISPAYRCLVHHDYTVILNGGTNTSHNTKENDTQKDTIHTLSLRKLLHKVRDAIEMEIYETGYFTFKLTNYHLQGYRFFEMLRKQYPVYEVLYQGWYNSEILCYESKAFRHTQALEQAIMRPLLDFLDNRRDVTNVELNSIVATSTMHDICNDLFTLLTKYFMPPKSPYPSQHSFRVPTHATVGSFEQIEYIATQLNDEYRNIVGGSPTFYGHAKAPFDGFYRLTSNNTSKVWLIEEFGHFTSTQLHRAAELDNESGGGNECYGFMMDTLEETEEEFKHILIKPSDQRNESEKQLLRMKQDYLKFLIQRLGRENPVMFTRVEIQAEQLMTSILDHAICGLWRDEADRDLVEWILQIWGYNFNPLMSHTHLQIAILERQRWVLELLLRQDAGKTVNFQSRINGNTAMHYAAMAGDKSMITCISSFYCDTSIRNHRGQLAADVIPMQYKDVKQYFVKRMGGLQQQEKAKLIDIANNGPEKRTMASFESSKARQHVKMKQLREEEKQYTPTAEDIARAEKAQQELLDMLEKEEKSTGKKKGGGGGGGGKKQGSKKKK
jgi:hypothetical protein